MAIAQAEMFSLGNLYVAYKKAKAEAFYENTHFHTPATCHCLVGPAKLKSVMVRAPMRTLVLGLRRDLIQVDEICRSRRSRMP